VLRLAAVLVFFPHIKEPKARPTREALRFMESNIYNNLFSVGEAEGSGFILMSC
jgi:hypothetical protein